MSVNSFSVSKWSEIIYAIENGIGDVTITLSKNINLAEEVDYIFGVEALFLSANITSLTFEGEGHRIINLTNDLNQVGAIFKTYANNPVKITFKNLDFINLTLNNISLVYGQNATDEVEAINCGFVGERNGTSYLFDISYKVTLKVCFFNIPWIGTGQNPQKYLSLVTPPSSSSTATAHKAEYCWFKEHYTNWTLKNWSYNDVNTANKSTIWSFYFFMLDGCRIDGDMTMLGDSHTGRSSTVPIDLVHHKNRTEYTPTKMNVFDVDVTVGGAFTQANFGSWFGLYVNKVYNSNDELITNWSVSYDTNTGSTYPCPIIATEEEAQSEATLAAMGFAI